MLPHGAAPPDAAVVRSLCSLPRKGSAIFAMLALAMATTGETARAEVLLMRPSPADSASLVVPAQAAGSRKPVINVGKVILAEPAAETALPIQVSPVEAIPPNSFIRIRGLPPKAALSEGHSIAPGAWAVPLAFLPSLKITLPVGLAGKSDVTIALVQIDGTIVAETRTALVIAAAALIAPDSRPPVAANERSVASVGRTAPVPAPVASLPLEKAPPPAVPAPPKVPALTEAQQRALGFIVRGRAQVQEGNIAAARLFFQRAADAGLADGALAIAGTYDPAELRRMRVTGVEPDIALARQWYEKARSLGAVEADERLRQLGAR